MTLPKKYLPLPSPVTANFTDTDVVQGKGILKLWATSANWSDNDPPNGSSILISSQTDCGMYTLGAGKNHPRNTYIVNTTKTFTMSSLVRPMIVNGQAYIPFTICHTSTGTGTSTWTVSIEKNGVSLVSGSLGLTPSPGSIVATFNQILTVPRTSFKIGDILGLSISNTMTATARAFLEHDSLNRSIASYTPGGSVGDHPAITSTVNPTECLLYLPVEIKI